ncbi:hypothetical protein Dimus_016475 [Dionaea muscipula]
MESSFSLLMLLTNEPPCPPPPLLAKVELAKEGDEATSAGASLLAARRRPPLIARLGQLPLLVQGSAARWPPPGTAVRRSPSEGAHRSPCSTCRVGFNQQCRCPQRSTLELAAQFSRRMGSHACMMMAQEPPLKIR